jgi:hypothetical protein
VNQHVGPNEKVMINDGMVYYLDVPFINVHSLHSAYIRYDRVNSEGFAGIMKREHVSMALIRRGISGFARVTDDYLKNSMTLIRQSGPIELYVLKDK